MSDITDLSPGLMVVFGALVFLQLALEVGALVVLFRTPEERVLGGRRWPWALAIVFINLIGAVAFLAAGRRPRQAEDPIQVRGDAGAPGERAQRAVDVLYGERDGEDR